jgi:hypothetical protein
MPILAAHVTLRHDILKGILRRAVHRAGIASTLEPPFRRLPGLSAGSGTVLDGSATRAEARGDILMVLPQGISIADVSVVHSLSINTLPQAATTVGAAVQPGTCRSGAHTLEWSRMAMVLSPSLWSLTDAWACRQLNSCMSFEMRPLDLEVFRVLLCRESAVRDQYRTHSGDFFCYLASAGMLA